MSRVPPEGTWWEIGQPPGLPETTPEKRADKPKKEADAATGDQPAKPPAKEAVPEHPAGSPETEEAGASAARRRTERQSDREAASQTLRRRVELAELYNRVAPAERGAVLELQASLARYGGDWHLEQGRLLYNRIVRREIRQLQRRPVEITHRFAWRRDPEAHLDPALLSEEVSEVLDTEEPPEAAVLRLRPLRKRVSQKDTVLVRWRSPGRPETVIEITAREVRLRESEESAPAPAEGPPESDGNGAEQGRLATPHGEAVVTPDLGQEESNPTGPAEVVLFERPEPDRRHPEPPPPLTPEEAAPRLPLDEAAEAAWLQEQAERVEAEDGEEDDRETAGQEVAPPPERRDGADRATEPQTQRSAVEGAPAKPVSAERLLDAERPSEDAPPDETEPTDPGPEPGALPPLRETLEALSSVGDRAVAATLPPVAGGSGELPADRRRRQPTVTETPPRRPPPRRLAAHPQPPLGSAEQPVQIPPSRAGERIGLHPERVYPAERRPSARLRRKARKLARILARRYHLKLTPELEAYLVALMLQPQTVNGRRVIGLSVNRDALLRVLSTLWLNFGDLYVLRPKPPPSASPPPLTPPKPRPTQRP